MLILFVYGICRGIGKAGNEYRLRFPSRRAPNHQTLSALFNPRAHQSSSAPAYQNLVGAPYVTYTEWSSFVESKNSGTCQIGF